jgi:hypothetical protein
MSATRPDLLAALPGLVAARIRLFLPALRECRGIAGRFNLDMLKAKGVAAPAVLVSRLRLRQDQTFAGPHHTFNVQMGAFIVAKDELGLGRDEAVANIAQALLQLIPDTLWGLPADLGPAQDVAEEPILSVSTESRAVALSAVTWSQQVALRGLPEALAITPQLYLGQAPRIGAAYENDYDLIGGAA